MSVCMCAGADALHDEQAHSSFSGVFTSLADDTVITVLGVLLESFEGARVKVCVLAAREIHFDSGDQSA